MNEDPKTLQVRAVDVLPFVHGILAEGPDGFYPDRIVDKRWSEYDPDEVVLRLEAHTSSFVGANVLVEVAVMPVIAIGYLDPKHQEAEQERFLASRPSGANIDLKGLDWKVAETVAWLRKLGWTCIKPKECVS